MKQELSMNMNAYRDTTISLNGSKTSMLIVGRRVFSSPTSWSEHREYISQIAKHGLHKVDNPSPEVSQ